jgi:hypothetical protein
MAGLVNFMGNKKPAGVRLQAEAWRVIEKSICGEPDDGQEENVAANAG